MGTGSSVQPKQGVLANPRILYADQLAKKNKKSYRIDAPVLIDLDHGSIRYRYATDDTNKKARKSEIPYEGDETTKKGHYFYHPRLNDFSEKAALDKEDPHKFTCVVKGPVSSKQKKIFYVYGRGWDAKDGLVTKPTDTRAMGQDPTWPQRQNPNDVYYNIDFLDTVVTEDPIAGIPNRRTIQFPMSIEDNVQDLRIKIAKNIIKSAANVHVCYQHKEIRGEHDLIGALREEGNQSESLREEGNQSESLREEGNQSESFAVQVTLMDH